MAGEATFELVGEGEELGVGDGLLRVRLRETTGAVLDRKAVGEGETPGLTKGRLGEPVVALPPRLDWVGVALANPKLSVDDEAADGEPNGSLDGDPKESEDPDEGRPKPKPMGDGRGAEGKGMVGPGCWVMGCAMAIEC